MNPSHRFFNLILIAACIGLYSGQSAGAQEWRPVDEWHHFSGTPQQKQTIMNLVQQRNQIQERVNASLSAGQMTPHQASNFRTLLNQNLMEQERLGSNGLSVADTQTLLTSLNEIDAQLKTFESRSSIVNSPDQQRNQIQARVNASLSAGQMTPHQASNFMRLLNQKSPNLNAIDAQLKTFETRSIVVNRDQRRNQIQERVNASLNAGQMTPHQASNFRNLLNQDLPNLDAIDAQLKTFESRPVQFMQQDPHHNPGFMQEPHHNPAFHGGPRDEVSELAERISERLERAMQSGQLSTGRYTSLKNEFNEIMGRQQAGTVSSNGHTNFDQKHTLLDNLKDLNRRVEFEK